MTFRYILLSIRSFDKNFTFVYEGKFNTMQDIDRYVEERELGAEYTARNIADGITLYTVGKNPDSYIAFDVKQITDYPALLGRLQK